MDIVSVTLHSSLSNPDELY